MAVLFRIVIGDEARTYFISLKQLEIHAFATVDSFTVECKIPEELYESIKEENEYEPAYSHAMYFKNWLRDQI